MPTYGYEFENYIRGGYPRDGNWHNDNGNVTEYPSEVFEDFTSLIKDFSEMLKKNKSNKKLFFHSYQIGKPTRRFAGETFAPCGLHVHFKPDGDCYRNQTEGQRIYHLMKMCHVFFYNAPVCLKSVKPREEYNQTYREFFDYISNETKVVNDMTDSFIMSLRQLFAGYSTYEKRYTTYSRSAVSLNTGYHTIEIRANDFPMDLDQLLLIYYITTISNLNFRKKENKTITKLLNNNSKNIQQINYSTYIENEGKVKGKFNVTLKDLEKNKYSFYNIEGKKEKENLSYINFIKEIFKHIVNSTELKGKKVFSFTLNEYMSLPKFIKVMYEKRMRLFKLAKRNNYTYQIWSNRISSLFFDHDLKIKIPKTFIKDDKK